METMADIGNVLVILFLAYFSFDVDEQVCKRSVPKTAGLHPFAIMKYLTISN